MALSYDSRALGRDGLGGPLLDSRRSRNLGALAEVNGLWMRDGLSGTNRPDPDRVRVADKAGGTQTDASHTRFTPRSL